MRSLPVGLQSVKLKDLAKHVELMAEGLRTRVQFPPPPPNNSPRTTQKVLKVAFRIGIAAFLMVCVIKFELLSKPITLSFSREVSDQVGTNTNNGWIISRNCSKNSTSLLKPSGN